MKVARIKLHVRVALDALSVYYDCDLVEALHILARTKFIAETMYAIVAEEYHVDMINAKYFAEKYHAIAHIASRHDDALTRDVIERATRNADIIVKLFTENYDNIDEYVDNIIEAYYSTRGGDEE